MVRSTFKIVRVWTGLLVFPGILLFGLDLILFPKPMSYKHNSANSILPGFLFLFLGIYVIYLMFKYLTVISIGDEIIGLKNLFFRKELLPAEIRSIALYGRERLNGSKYATETIVLTLEEAALAEKFPDKITDLPGRKEKGFVLTWHPDWTTEEGMDTFKGNPLLSMGTIIKVVMVAGFVGFGLLLRQGLLHSTRHYRPETTQEHVFLYYLPFAAIILTFFFMQAHELYYFRLSSGGLVVRNHCYPWINKVYAPDDLSAILLYNDRNGAMAMNIRTKDFGSYRFGADSLKKETWQAFASELEALGIPVINEIRGLAQPSADSRSADSGPYTSNRIAD